MLNFKRKLMEKRLMLLMAYLMIGIGLATAQVSKVTGLVISEEDGLPVVGASVLVKGTTVGTVTDIDGKFTINNVPSSAKTLKISYIGLQSQEVTVKSYVKVVLKADAESLDEVLVTAYGVSTKGSFTGSAAVMKADKIEKRQVSNVSNALAGAVAGVQIQSKNGQPGESAKVRVRGVGSINAGTEPLYVVDGVPYDGELSSINTADIETMTVLKDAASTALYGARGANGIIMITTKKGVSGKARVNFDAKWGVNSRAVKNYDVLTSPKNYLEKAYEAIYNGYVQTSGMGAEAANVSANSTLLTTGNGGVGYQVYTVPSGELLIGSNGQLNPNATLGYTDRYGYYYTPDNWADEMFSNNLRQEYNLNVSGGNDRSTFYMAFGYLDDQGVISGSGFKRYSGRLKGDYKVNDWLKVGANVNYIYSESRYPGDQTQAASSGNAFAIANNIAPIYPLYVRGADKQIMMNGGRKMYDYGDGESTPSDRAYMSIANPAGDLAYNKDEYLSDIINSNWFAEITPVKGLTVSARFGLNIDNTRENHLGNAYMGQSASYGGSAYQKTKRTYGLDQQYVANYTFSLDHLHNFDFTVGYDGYSYKYTYLAGSAQNLYDPESFFTGNAIDKKTTSGSQLTYATEGFFGRANYSYDEKYFANVSYRRDASSRFSKENRWGDFWAASLAWMISREKFMNNVEWVDMLKLKASLGQQGNDDILFQGGNVIADHTKNFYPWRDQFSITGANGVFSDGTLVAKGNSDITWETSTSYNVGVDFSLFHSRLSGSLEYFGRKSSDMLYNKPVAGSVGYTYIPMNIGSMTNSGFEMDFNYKILNSKNVSWDVNFNATFIKNKINKLHPDLDGQLIDVNYIYEEGESMYRMYLVEYAGVNKETGEAMYWAKKDNGELYATANYSIAQSTNKVATQNLMPKVYGGIGTSVQAYGFDASLQLSYQLGGKIYDSGYRSLMQGKGSGQNWHKDIYKAWTPENTETDVPRLNAQDRYTYTSSTRWLTNSNYLSLNNITVGYTLPKELVRKMMLEKLRIYFAADNVALISARKGLDPRQSYTTATTSTYTAIRTISGGVSLTF